MRVLGKEYPKTLMTMNSLAVKWKCSGWDTDALKLITDSLLLAQGILWDSHPNRVACSERVKS
jgi:hypothetical protein